MAEQSDEVDFAVAAYREEGVWVVQELAPGSVEIAAIDPVASMQGVGNPALADVAATVQAKLRNVIARLEGSAP